MTTPLSPEQAKYELLLLMLRGVPQNAESLATLQAVVNALTPEQAIEVITQLGEDLNADT